MSKLYLVWWKHQAELEGRHSQAELGNETKFFKKIVDSTNPLFNL